MRAELDREQMILTVRGLLREHKGPGNCITMYQLYHHVTGRPIIPALKVNQTRLLRSIVAQLQRDGEPIVHTSGDAGGYYYATNSADIDKDANAHSHRCAVKKRLKN